MAIVKCPECNREVSDKASACPNCGYQINSVKTDVQDNLTFCGMFIVALIPSIFISVIICGCFGWGSGAGMAIIFVLTPTITLLLMEFIDKK